MLNTEYKNNTRVGSLDFIRVISFLMIVSHHFVGSISTLGIKRSYFNCFYLGGVGVSFFIITSGASLYLSIKNEFNLKIYIKKRIANIYPYFWICYTLVAIFIFFTSSIIPIGLDPLKLLITFLALDGYLGSTISDTYYLIGEWFTGFILLIYILFPIVVWIKNKSILLSIVIVFIVSYFSINNTDYISDNFFLWNKDPFWNPLSRLPEILLGILMIDYLLIKNQKLNLILSLVAFIYIVIILVFTQENYRTYNSLGISMWAMTFVIITCLYENIKINNFFNKIILFLSEYSFIAFLLHHQIINFLVSKINTTEFNRFHFLCFYVAIVIICYFLGYLIKPTADKLKYKILSFKLL